MKQKINKAILATNGKKTTTTAMLMLVVAILGDKVPFIKENQYAIDLALNSALVSALVHKAWKWKGEKVWNKLKNKFKK